MCLIMSFSVGSKIVLIGTHLEGSSHFPFNFQEIISKGVDVGDWESRRTKKITKIEE